MRTGVVTLGSSIFETLLAISAEEKSQGLMFVDPPVPNMSFVYPYSQINKFWMSNTKAPLDIIFCHKNKVSQICYGEPFSTRIIGADEYSDLIVELPFGTVKQANIKLGQYADLISPKISELKKIFYRF